MRAVELHSYGDPAVGIHVVDLPEPISPGPGEVLVEVDYAPVNLNDLLVLQGLFPVHPELPSPVGNEGVGRILAAGPGVSNVSVGDVVALPLYSLTWRERLVVAASAVTALPIEADLQQLSMIRINAVTAALLLSEYAQLSGGDWIIQNAGNSALARSVTAIAKSRGFRTISLVRRASVIDDVVAAGADASFVDDDDAPEQIKELVGTDGIKLGIDGVGGSAVGRLAAALSVGGVVVSYGVLGGDTVASANILEFMFKNLTYQAFYVDRPEYGENLSAILAETSALIASGALRVPVAAVYPIDEVAQAIAHAQTGGKVLLKLATQPATPRQ